MLNCPNLLWLCLPKYENLVNYIPQTTQQLCSICKLFLQFDVLMWELEGRWGHLWLWTYIFCMMILCWWCTQILKYWIFFSCGPVISFMEDWGRWGRGETEADGQRWESFHMWRQQEALWVKVSSRSPLKPHLLRWQRYSLLRGFVELWSDF